MVSGMTIYKHVLGGPQTAGDYWTSGFHSEGTITIAAAHAVWAATVDEFVTAVKSHWAAATAVTTLTTYTIDTLTGKANGVQRSAVAIVGTSAGSQPSPRDCLVVGLRTDYPGPANRGRMYLPAPSVDKLDADGMIEPATRIAFANGIAGALQNMPLTGLTAGIFSPGTNSVTPFTSVTVGQVQGTQRRRTNKILPAYSTAAVG